MNQLDSSLFHAILKESQESAVKDFILSPSKNKSSKTFRNSKFYYGSADKRGRSCKAEDYYQTIRDLLHKDEITLEQIGNAFDDEHKGPYSREDSIEITDEDREFLKDLDTEESDVNLDDDSKDDEDLFRDITNSIYDIVDGSSIKRHLCVYGDPGVGKTHTIMEAIDEAFKNEPFLKKKTIVSGSMSRAIPAVAAFFYAHRNNELIVFDDCDSVLKDSSLNLSNLMKAILDPDPDKKASVMFSKDGLKAYYEAYKELCGDDAEKPETEFKFSSSVVFISNLNREDVNQAVADRCLMISVHLEFSDFIKKLSKIFPNLYDTSRRNIASWVGVWAKSTAYKMLRAIFIRYVEGERVAGMPVVINRKFTFRLFDALCDEWRKIVCEYARAKGIQETVKTNIKPWRDDFCKKFFEHYKNRYAKTVLKVLAQYDKD
jgi:hypothetical protein